MKTVKNATATAAIATATETREIWLGERTRLLLTQWGEDCVTAVTQKWSPFRGWQNKLQRQVTCYWSDCTAPELPGYWQYFHANCQPHVDDIHVRWKSRDRLLSLFLLIDGEAHYLAKDYYVDDSID